MHIALQHRRGSQRAQQAHRYEQSHDVYCHHIRRTQIYITEEQERLIANKAADAGVPKAEVIRRILDSALGLDAGAAERRRAILATAGVMPDADDWPAWLAQVRGAGADDRLARLQR